MELVLVFTFVALIGAAVRYTVPGRNRHGMIALPALQVGLATLLFVIAMWLGLEPRSVWPWIISLVGSTAAHVAVAIWLPGKRDADDAALLAELTAPGAPIPEEPARR